MPLSRPTLDEKDENELRCNLFYVKKVFLKHALKLEMNEGLFVNVEGDIAKMYIKRSF